MKGNDKPTGQDQGPDQALFGSWSLEGPLVGPLPQAALDQGDPLQVGWAMPSLSYLWGSGSSWSEHQLQARRREQCLLPSHGSCCERLVANMAFCAPHPAPSGDSCC